MDENEQCLFMQVRILRKTAEATGLSLKEAARLFQQHAILAYLREGYGIFHTEGDEAVLAHVLDHLKTLGALP